MTSTHTHIAAKQLHIAVLQTLRYFEFFEHALYGKEVHKYLTTKSTWNQLSTALNHLCETGEIVSKDGLYALNKGHIELRLRHIERNQKMMKAAKRVGAFIHLFPYVRGVYLSGSLSKHGITGQDDDLFMNTLVPYGYNLRRWIVFEALQKLKHDMFADIASCAENPKVFDRY